MATTYLKVKSSKEIIPLSLLFEWNNFPFFVERKGFRFNPDEVKRSEPSVVEETDLFGGEIHEI